MKSNLEWLRQWTDWRLSLEDLCSGLTMSGLEIDALSCPVGDFSGIVVAEILTVRPHRRSSHLKVCRLSLGAAAPVRQVVTGVGNVLQGKKVAYAPVGAVLAGGRKIEKVTVQGEESVGMLCGAADLGITDSSEKLIELGEASLGASVFGLLGGGDTVLDFDLTPNRSDCLSIVGIAREIAALNHSQLQLADIAAVPVQHNEAVHVDLTDAAACPRFVTCVIRSVRSGRGSNYGIPLQMREFLRRCGVSSIHPVVDILNYVMLEYGQPMHAYDRAKVEGGMQVRHSRQQEELTVIGGKSIVLDAGSLVVADSSKAIALAGIIGGLDTAIQEDTSDIILESAFFSPEALHGCARRHGLRTEASHRFERGVDYQLAKTAMEYAVGMIICYCGGLAGPITETVHPSHLPKRREIVLRKSSISKSLGLQIQDNDVDDGLRNCGCTSVKNADEWLCRPPSYRFDLQIECDLVEEVARSFGYNNLRPANAVVGSVIRETGRERNAAFKGVSRSRLVEYGYNEVVSYSFVASKLQMQVMGDGICQDLVRLQNPLSEDLDAMRVSLWPGLIKTFLYNFNRQSFRVRLFEHGTVFQRQGKKVLQSMHIAGLVYNELFPLHRRSNPQADFFDVKGDIERLFSAWPDLSFSTAVHPALHDGVCARIFLNSEPVGMVGAMSPGLQRNCKLQTAPLLFFLDAGKVPAVKKTSLVSFSTFPEVRQDLALLVPVDVSYQRVVAEVLKMELSELQQVKIFDLYNGSGIQAGFFGMSLRFFLQSFVHTLEKNEIGFIMREIFSRLRNSLRVELRC